jgi:capsular polysaccharide transport system permease protein
VIMSDSQAIPLPQEPRPVKKRSFASLRAVFALVLREMSTSYGRSPGGYLWAVLEPIAGIAFLSMAFSIIMRKPPLGNSFMMFYATGMLPFAMFNDLHNKVSQSLLYSRQLLSYPNVTYFDALLARFLLNMITNLLVSYVVLAGTMILFEGRMHIELVKIVKGFGLSASLGLGIGTLNAFIIAKIPVWQQAWSVMMRPLFLLSGVMIPFGVLPEPYRSWLWWNPLIHVTGMVRSGFYDFYDDYYVSSLYVMLVSMTCFMLGLLLLRRHHRDILDNA